MDVQITLDFLYTKIFKNEGLEGKKTLKNPTFFFF